MPPHESGAKAVQNIVRVAEEIKPRLQPLTAAEFLQLQLPPRKLLLAPWLPEKGLVMIHAPRGLGKTLFAMTSAYAIAAGDGFLKFTAQEPRRVLYVDGEMPARTMQDRFAAIIASMDRQPPDTRYFRFLSSDLTERGLPDLGAPEGQAELDEIVDDADLIVVDNISTLVRSGKENEAESWVVVQEWALNHRRAGRSILFIHHAGKGGAQRGTSKREDVLDTVVGLRRPADYTSAQGARFEVHFEKARGLHGADAESFEASYEARDGRALWAWRMITDVEIGRVADAIREGASIRETAKELGMNKSKVERLKKKATEKGLLSE